MEMGSPSKAIDDECGDGVTASGFDYNHGLGGVVRHFGGLFYGVRLWGYLGYLGWDDAMMKCVLVL
jgi:hypothetical protein